MPRSTFYAIKARAARPNATPAKRGPKTQHTDAQLTDLIRGEIAASPFHGEGHRKIWARLRYQGIRTSKPRVLRLMREAQLLARLLDSQPLLRENTTAASSPAVPTRSGAPTAR